MATTPKEIDQLDNANKAALVGFKELVFKVEYSAGVPITTIFRNTLSGIPTFSWDGDEFWFSVTLADEFTDNLFLNTSQYRGSEVPFDMFRDSNSTVILNGLQSDTGPGVLCEIRIYPVA